MPEKNEHTTLKMKSMISHMVENARKKPMVSRWEHGNNVRQLRSGVLFGPGVRDCFTRGGLANEASPGICISEEF